MSVSFTGHRPDKLGGYTKFKSGYPIFDFVKTALWSRINWLGVHGHKDFYCGGAQGIDNLAASLVLQAKREYDSDIRLIMCIPFPSFSAVWPEPSQKELASLIDQADDLVVMGEEPNVALYQVRNEYMVDNSDVVVAVWDRSSGGTANCVKYAFQQGRFIDYIHPYMDPFPWPWWGEEEGATPLPTKEKGR